MGKIYCTKCGIRGISKCPHCRSVFGDRPSDEMQVWAQEYFEVFMSVGVASKNDRERLENGEDARFEVKFWTYAPNRDEAILSILKSLKESLPNVNLDVAACVHDWELMPGERSSIGCGHIGPQLSESETLPENPYA